MTSPPDFINRSAEVKLFNSMLTPNSQKRVLALLIKPEQGKTYLLNYLRGLCRSKQIRSALVDFDARQRGSVFYWKFIRQVYDQLGPDNFPEVHDCENQHYSILPFIQIQTGKGEAGIDFGRRADLEDAELTDIAGRDRIVVRDITYNDEKGMSAAHRERVMYEMGRAFQSDLTKISEKNPVVLFLDTYEQVSRETRIWINEWLFSRLLDHYPNIIIVIAARPDFMEYLKPRSIWQALMHIQEELSYPNEEDVRKYTKLSGLQVAEDQFKILMQAARHEIALLAKLCDLIRKSSYG